MAYDDWYFKLPPGMLEALETATRLPEAQRVALEQIGRAAMNVGAFESAADAATARGQIAQQLQGMSAGLVGRSDLATLLLRRDEVAAASAAAVGAGEQIKVLGANLGCSSDLAAQLLGAASGGPGLLASWAGDAKLLGSLGDIRGTLATALGSYGGSAVTLANFAQALDLSALSQQVAAQVSPQAFVERFPVPLRAPAARVLVHARRSAREVERLEPAEFDTELSPAATVFSQVTFVGSVGAPSGVTAGPAVRDRRQALLQAAEEALEARLGPEPEMLRRLQGARRVLRDRDNPDRGTQFCGSMRGLFDLVLRRLVSEGELGEWAAREGQLVPAQSRRYNWFLFLDWSVAGGRLAKLIRADVAAAVEVVRIMDAALHQGGQFVNEELETLQLRAELLLWRLVTHPRFTSPSLPRRG